MKNCLVEPAWLDNQGNLFLIDATLSKAVNSSDSLSERKYIKGTIDIDFEQVFFAKESNVPHSLPESHDLDSSLMTFDIDRDSHILVYDAIGNYSSLRAFFTLKGFGYKNVSVLNGGMIEWEKQGRATIDKGKKVKPKDNPRNQETKPKIKNSFIIDKEEFETLRSTPSNIVIDARSKKRFLGLEGEPRPGIRKGHIPGAINMPYTTLMDEHRFKKKECMEELFSGLNIKNNSKILAYCGSGITACIVAFAGSICDLDLLIYDGSWAQWGLIKYPCYETDHYELDSGVEIQKESPDTFYLPSEESRTNLKPGDLVKLIFRMEKLSDPESLSVERMWVMVKEKNKDCYLGVLDNDPFGEVHLQCGQPVCFGPEHVIQIDGEE